MGSRDEKLRSLIAEQAAEWHVACTEGDLSPQQAREFMHWLRASPMHVAEFLTVSRIASDVAEAASGNRDPLESLLAGADEPVRLPTAGTVRSAQLQEPPSPQTHRRTRSRWMARVHGAHRRPVGRRVAAIATLAVVFAVLSIGLYRLASPPAGEVFATRHGEVRNLRLPDGTFVQLDSHSAITVRYDRGNRTVAVDRGQAYFDVAKDSGRPFRVQVGDVLIRDIGTAFDVYRRPTGTTVTVSTGRVEVWSQPGTAAEGRDWLSRLGFDRGLRGSPVASLGGGQEVLLTDAGQVARLGEADLRLALAWRDGRIAFDHQSIASVAAELNRYNDVQVTVEDPQIGAIPISGMLDAHDVQAFVAFLRSQPNVAVLRRGQTMVVGAK